MVVCQACLEHRHSYVRKNAALAVLNIHHNFGQDLLPDGPELIDKFIKVRLIAPLRQQLDCTESFVMQIIHFDSYITFTLDSCS